MSIVHLEVWKALAAGVPTVISAAVAVDLGPSVKNATCVGPGPESFKSCVLKIHNDKNEWTKLHLSALALIENNPLTIDLSQQWKQVLNIALATKTRKGESVNELGIERSHGHGSLTCKKIDNAYIERYDEVKATISNGTFFTGLDHFLHQSPSSGFIYNDEHEKAYLANNPIVVHLINGQKVKSGWHHFILSEETGSRYIYSPIDDSAYLTRYKDISMTLEKHEIKSSWYHYNTFGRHEGRIYGCY
jgi:hypothetical protein